MPYKAAERSLAQRRDFPAAATPKNLTLRGWEIYRGKL